jgi:hypothetical protein
MREEVVEEESVIGDKEASGGVFLEEEERVVAGIG